MPKFVFSRTLTQADWRTEVICDVVPEQIEALEAQPGGDIALSGANLAATFMRHGLIDEFRILFHPVVLGQGRPLFEAPDVRTDLRLKGTRAFGNGVVLLHYSNDRA
ncbi:dihydrofolate reductase family protein [Arthrobacter sp. SO3]|uniref:dihydrofolate reductase family protein n=1 Tax=Arthrobacter sp. SO3 TaxID=1897057 RepID=UPI0021F64054|nr:dihydrofolate reductase family protein [Arthrobacter sp. SO3]MCB5294785.1 hypothetical protein [Arthrobacter sp. SO3]